MTRIVGEVAALYDDVRPGYPASVLDAIVGHHGGTPASVADLGSGTGKGTDLLVRLGAPVKSQADRIGAVLTAIDPTVQDRADHWVLDDVTASGIWSGVTEKVWHSYPVFSRQKYLQLMQTFSPFRRHCAQDQAAALAGLDAALDDFGGSVTLDLITTLVLARRV